MQVINSRVRSMRPEALFAKPKPPVQKVLASFQNWGEPYAMYSNTISIAMSRDMEGNVTTSMQLAMLIACKFPEERVLLVNCYAGTALSQRALAESIKSQCDRTNRKVPSELREQLKHIPYLTDQHFDDTPFDVPENFRVIDCPTGVLTAKTLEQEVQEMNATVVIVNSLEHVMMTRYLMWHFAQGLIGMQQRMQLAVIVFSSEIRNDLARFRAGRGALGLLSANASTVFKMEEESEKRKKEGKNDDIHEKQTQKIVDEVKDFIQRTYPNMTERQIVRSNLDTPFSSAAAEEQDREKELQKRLTEIEVHA